jgi:glycosyltransferase involved in cell wall biosynthesis
MRIVVCARHFAEYSVRFANALAAASEVLLFIDSANAERQWSIGRIPVRGTLKIVRLNFRMKGLGVLSVFRMVARTIAFRPDYIHFHEIPDPITPLLLFLLRRMAVVGMTVHDPQTHSGVDSRLPRVLMKLKKFGRRQAQLVFLHGQYCMRSYLATEPDNRSIVVCMNHGVLMREALSDVPRTENMILMFGRMESYKGVDVFARAAELLLERGVACNLVVAGRGEGLRESESLLRRLPNVRVLADYIASGDAQCLFRQAVVAVLPYKDATQSGVVASAFGNDCPVVASSVGGLPDVVNHGVNGLLVPPNDHVALADALQLVLSDERLRKKLQDGARQSAEHEMNWDVIVGAIMPEIARLTRDA